MTATPEIANDPPTPQAHTAPPQSEEQTPRRGFPLWYLLLAVLVVTAVIRGPQEISRWYLAAAQEAALDEQFRLVKANSPPPAPDFSAAIDMADAALWWDPDSRQILLQRAQWKLANEDLDGALEDCNAAIDQNRGDAQPYFIRADIYLQAGRSKDCIADCSKLVRLAEDRDSGTLADRLNHRAYLRAVIQWRKKPAERDREQLDLALADIQRACNIFGPAHVTTPEAYLDTRAFIYYLRGQFKLAIDDQNDAVREGESLFEQQQRILSTQRLRTVDHRQLLLEERRAKRHLAVIYYHRALIQLALGKKDHARKDVRRIRQLGFEPSRSLY